MGSATAHITVTERGPDRCDLTCAVGSSSTQHGAMFGPVVTWSPQRVVSSHWFDQADDLGRAVYVDALVKGPGNKPLVITPTVHVWRR